LRIYKIRKDDTAGVSTTSAPTSSDARRATPVGTTTERRARKAEKDARKVAEACARADTEREEERETRTRIKTG
jgi:hypothetical protein